MRAVLSTILIAALAAAAPSAASAQAAAPTDVRCLLSMAALASNPKAREQAMAGVYYFAARVTARNPRFNFATDLRAEAEKVSRAQLQADANRCGSQLISVSRNLDTAQKSLQGYQPK